MATSHQRPRSELSNSERRADSAAKDLRVRRSKGALHRGLLSLIEDMPFAEITVDDIAARAGVGRATFYRHYATKDDLLEKIATNEIETLVDLSLPLLSKSDTRRSCLALCRYVDQHRTLWATLLTGGASGVMRETFIRLARQRGHEQLNSSEARLPVDLGATCGVALTFEILAWWLQQEEPVPAEQTAEYLDRLAVTPALNY